MRTVGNGRRQGEDSIRCSRTVHFSKYLISDKVANPLGRYIYIIWLQHQVFSSTIDNQSENENNNISLHAGENVQNSQRLRGRETGRQASAGIQSSWLTTNNERRKGGKGYSASERKNQDPSPNEAPKPLMIMEVISPVSWQQGCCCLTGWLSQLASSLPS